MTALSRARVPDRYGVGLPNLHSLPMAAATKILAGAIVCKDAAGNAVNGTAATGLLAVGVACHTADSNAGDETIQVESGCFDFANSLTTDAIGETEKFKDVFIVDNATVAKTDGTGTRSRAGQVERLEGGRVYVNINPLSKGV